MKTPTQTMYLLAASLSFGACAHEAPTELVRAREAYSRALNGKAQQFVPAEVHKAKESLSTAEAAFEDSPKAQKTRDLAYVAERKAQTAEALAQIEIDKGKRVQAERDYGTTNEQLVKSTRSELDKSKQQLTQREIDLRDKQNQLGTERSRREDAEKRAKEEGERAKAAQDALAKLAAVKEEARGLVITLSGSVLFPSNQSTLLPEAQSRLGQVSAALMASKERKIVIEGHTDSRGSDTFNAELSRKRAEAVRGYLVQAGYDGDLISTDGVGEARPIADNNSAEGRANNRRVEIVVKNKE